MLPARIHRRRPPASHVHSSAPSPQVTVCHPLPRPHPRARACSSGAASTHGGCCGPAARAAALLPPGTRWVAGEGWRGCGHSGPAGACNITGCTALCRLPCLPPGTKNPTPHCLTAHPCLQGPPPWGPVAWLWLPPASCRPVWWPVPLRWQSVRSRLAGQQSGLHCWPALRQAAPAGSLWLSSTPASSRGCRRQPSGSGWKQQQAQQRRRRLGAAPVWR